MEKEEQIIAGYIEDPIDSRDYRTEEFFGAGEPFDWNKGYDIEEDIGIKLSVNDQGTSYSCVGQAKSKDREVKEFLDRKNYALQSARSIYAFRANYPRKGMHLRDACDIEINRGIALRDDVPDFQTESEMNVKPSDSPRTKSLSYLAFDFFGNIDKLAQHIRDHKGVMIAYDGRNNGTNRVEHPTLPNHWSEKQWSHCVFAAKAKMVDGEKRIYILNSWGERTGRDGWQYFTEEDLQMKPSGYSPFYRGWITTDLIEHNQKSMAEKFIEKNEGKLVQMTGEEGTGEFGIIAKGKLLTGNQLKVLLTWAVRNFGRGIPKSLWTELPQKDIESKE